MTKRQKELFEQLGSLREAIDQQWLDIVGCVNDLSSAIDRGEDTSATSAMFPPELELAFDDMALRSAWIYGRLERPQGRKSKTYRAINKALGYTSI